MSYNPDTATLEFRIEVALKKFLISCALPQLAEANLFTGENAEPKILPAIICKCLGGPEEPEGTGCILEDVYVCIDSNADLSNSNADPLPGHRQLVRAVKWHLWDNKRDASGQEWLHSYLSCQVPNLNILREIKFDGPQEVIQGRHITTDLHFSMAANQMSGLPDAQADYAAGRLVLGTDAEDVALLAILNA